MDTTVTYITNTPNDGEALLDQYDSMKAEGEAVQQEWVGALRNDQVQALAVALGRRSFEQMQEAERKRRNTGK